MKFMLLAFLFFGFPVFGQTLSKELNYNEFMGYVKKYHPLVKSANLEISKAQASLMSARGGFDPKIEVDFSKKEFMNKEYYSILNSSFKIPTWYGIEIKAGFDNNDGVYLNPENNTPAEGIQSLGISIPLGQDLLINQRMADVRKAKIQIELSQSQTKLQVIEILYQASIAYFNWKKNYDETVLYEAYSTNAQSRLKGIKNLIKQGDKPEIDSIEAGIIVKNRILNLEDSRLKLAKAKLELSNFLWLDNSIPVEISDELIPEIRLESSIEETLIINNLLQQDLSLKNHPKINALESKIEILNVEKKLKANMLLPKINVGYSYLSDAGYYKDYQLENYKVGVDFYFPLFLRKERGNLKLAKFKVQEGLFDLALEKVQLANKITSQKIEINSLLKQNELAKTLVNDNITMLKSEERLFSYGESSLFLINTRENNLVSAQLAAIALENRFYVSHAELFKIMANPD